MTKSKLGKFIDNFSIAFIFFTIFFIILRSFIKNILLASLISLFFSFLLIKIVLFFQNKHLNKLNIKSKEKQDIIDCNFALRTLSLSSQITFFKNLFKEIETIKTTNGLIINKTLYFYLSLNYDTINPENIYFIYSKIKNMKKVKIKEICLVCNNISEEAKLSIKQLLDINFTIFTPVETYALMKKFCYYPTMPKKPIKTKPNMFKPSFLKNKGKLFIKCGILIFLLSLITPFTTYYLVTASILTTFGFCLLLFGKPNSIKKSLSEQLLLTKNTPT